MSFLDPLPQKWSMPRESLLCIRGNDSQNGWIAADGHRMETDPVAAASPLGAPAAGGRAESGIIDDTAVVAALLSERDILQNGRAHFEKTRIGTKPLRASVPI